MSGHYAACWTRCHGSLVSPGPSPASRQTRTRPARGIIRMHGREARPGSPWLAVIADSGCRDRRYPTPPPHSLQGLKPRARTSLPPWQAVPTAEKAVRSGRCSRRVAEEAEPVTNEDSWAQVGPAGSLVLRMQDRAPTAMPRPWARDDARGVSRAPHAVPRTLSSLVICRHHGGTRRGEGTGGDRPGGRVGGHTPLDHSRRCQLAARGYGTLSGQCSSTSRRYKQAVLLCSRNGRVFFHLTLMVGEACLSFAWILSCGRFGNATRQKLTAKLFLLSIERLPRGSSWTTLPGRSGLRCPSQSCQRSISCYPQRHCCHRCARRCYLSCESGAPGDMITAATWCDDRGGSLGFAIASPVIAVDNP